MQHEKLCLLHICKKKVRENAMPVLNWNHHLTSPASPATGLRKLFSTCFKKISFDILSCCLQQVPGGIWSSRRVSDCPPASHQLAGRAHWAVKRMHQQSCPSLTSLWTLYRMIICCCYSIPKLLPASNQKAKLHYFVPTCCCCSSPTVSSSSFLSLNLSLWAWGDQYEISNLMCQQG